MHIQSGIQFEPKGAEVLRMMGYVDYGQRQNGIQYATRKNPAIELATSVLQFVFLSYNGFRFPFLYRLTNALITGQLTAPFWKIVNTLTSYEFRIDFICVDWASVNRAFINSIVNQPLSIARNITSGIPSKIACIMDFSHFVKKIRNSIEASAPHLSDKALNFLRIHRKPTDDHFFLNSTHVCAQWPNSHSNQQLLLMNITMPS